MNDFGTAGRQQRDEHIISSSNPTIKLARSLHRRRVRQRERAILVEGLRAIATVAAHGARIRALLVDAGRSAHLPVDEMEALRRSTSRVLFVEPSLFGTLTDTEHPQAVIAICDMPESDLPSDSSLVLAIDGVRDPGNLGTLIRAAAGAGADGVALLPGSVDRFNLKTVRASAGAVFSVPVAPFPNLDHIVEKCFQDRPVIVVADGSGGTHYGDVNWSEPVILVIGGEAEGASEVARTYADFVARIPLDAAVESLNAGLAGAIMLFEARRQRDQAE